MLILSGCHSKNMEEDSVFKYKDSYVGDASAVGGILNHLQGEQSQGFELKTKEKPYGIIVNYDWSSSDLDYKKTAIYNATFLFTLIQNAEWVNFNFADHAYEIIKTDLESWYGENLSELENEDQLINLIEKYLGDEDKINELFDSL